MIVQCCCRFTPYRKGERHLEGALLSNTLNFMVRASVLGVIEWVC